MGCCGPSTCFTCNDYPKSSDACMCGCGYLNGMWPLFTAQFFTFIGAVLSLATLGDCAFAEIDRQVTIDLIADSSDGTYNLSKDVRGVGFITFETIDGHCYWYGEGAFANTQLEAYWDVLGDQWMIGMGLTWFCAIFAWYYFLYTLSFCCSSQVKCCRYFNGFCLAVILVAAQSATFIAYNSKFCSENNCSFARTSWYSVGAVACYLISGISFFLSKDYPGEHNMNYFRKNGDEVEDITNAVVYHPDPEMTPTEYKEAKRISQQLGGEGAQPNPTMSVSAAEDDDNNNDYYNRDEDPEQQQHEEAEAVVVEATSVRSIHNSGTNIDDSGDNAALASTSQDTESAAAVDKPYYGDENDDSHADDELSFLQTK